MKGKGLGALRRTLWRIGFWFAFGLGVYYSWSRLYRWARQRKWKGHVDALRTASEVWAVLRSREWKPDRIAEAGDAIGNPRHFLEADDSMGRDCDEFAAYALDAGRNGLEHRGTLLKPSRLLSCVASGGGHNVAVFRGLDEDSALMLWHFSNWGLRGPLVSLDAICADVCKRLDGDIVGWGSCDADLRPSGWKVIG